MTIAGIGSFFSDPPEQMRAAFLHGEGEHFSAGSVPVRIEWR
jgi:hypothetical protein